MKKTLILMCGIPASGKSTLAYNLSLYLDKAPIVSMDGIREEWFGTRKCQDKGWEVYSQSLDDVIWYFSTYDIVIYDATNRSKKARKQIVEDIQTYIDCDVYCIFMNTPIDIALDRNANRDESIQVPATVIHHMYDTLEPPTEKEKYFEKIFNVMPKTLDNSKDMWYNIVVNQIKGDLKI